MSWIPLAISLISVATVSTATSSLAGGDVPNQGHPYAAWLTKAKRDMHPHDFGDFYPLHTDQAWLNEYLARPDSIYSEVHERLYDSTKVFSGGFPVGADARAIAWDLGMYPGLVELASLVSANDRVGGLGGEHPWVLAQLVKAGVKPSLNARLFRLMGGFAAGADLSTLAAELGIAAEILRKWVAETAKDETDPAKRARKQARLGVRGDVLERFDKAGTLADLTDDDLTYLADILRMELSVLRVGKPNIYGIRELPTHLRIARLAAAARGDQRGACTAEGLSHAGSGTAPDDVGTDANGIAKRPICVSAATDRAVYQWYRAARRKQVDDVVASKSTSTAHLRLLAAFEDVKPAWAGAYPQEIVAQSIRSEVAESLIAMERGPGDVEELRFLQLLVRAHVAAYPGSRP